MDNLGEQQYERFYLDNLEGPEAYLEINWNQYVKGKGVVRLVVGGRKVVVDAEDLETILLAFTKRPDKFLRYRTQKMGLKYVPVPIDAYQKYKRWKEWTKHKTGKDFQADINKFI